MKRLLFFAALLFAAAALGACAAQGDAGEFGVRFSEDGDGFVITDVGTVTAADLEVPSSIRGFPVRAVADGAFENRTYLRSVTLPATLKRIGDSAFSGCTGLARVTLPAVETVGDSAFSGCTALTEIALPEGTLAVGDSAFSGCTALGAVTLPGTLLSLGGSVFSGCESLPSLSLPAGLRTLGEDAFSECYALERLTAAGGNFGSVDGVLYDGAFRELLWVPHAYAGEVKLPRGVTSLPDGCFAGRYGVTAVTAEAENPAYASVDGILYDRALTRFVVVPRALEGAVAIPEGVTEVPSMAFYGNTVTAIAFPSTLVSIAPRAFESCSALCSVTVSADNPVFTAEGNCVLTAERAVVLGCGASVIPADATEIGDYAFTYCRSLAAVTLPETLVRIGEDAFSGCIALEEIAIPASVKEIGRYAFYGCHGLERAAFASPAGWTAELPSGELAQADFSDVARAATLLARSLEGARFFRA